MEEIEEVIQEIIEAKADVQSFTKEDLQVILKEYTFRTYSVTDTDRIQQYEKVLEKLCDLYTLGYTAEFKRLLRNIVEWKESNKPRLGGFHDLRKQRTKAFFNLLNI